MQRTKKVLVIGITGGFGGAVAAVLRAQGAEVRALVRDVERAKTKVDDPSGVSWHAGDARDAAAVAEAAHGVDVIVHGFNVPYERWDPEVLDALEATCQAAARAGATILYPGNIYGLTPGLVSASEDAPREATSRKGRLRNRMLARLKRAADEGAKVVVVRAGDYFGGPGTNTWFAHVVGPAVRGAKALKWPTGADVAHEWAYLPDVAQAAVALLDVARPAFLERHVPGHVVTPAAVTETLSRTLNRPLRAKAMPWGLLRLFGPFSAMMRELVDVEHVWTSTVLLDGAALERELGGVPRTDFERAVSAAVAVL